MPDGELSVALTVLRVVRGWSQDDLARAAGVRSNSVSEYERGKKLPELKTLQQMLGAMGYPLAAVDLTQRFVQTLRTESAFADVGGRLWSAGEPAPGDPVGDEPAGSPASLQWELEQVSAEAGRVASRLTRLIFLLISRIGPPEAPRDRP